MIKKNEFKNLSTLNQKKYLNHELKKNCKKYFEKVTDEEFKEKLIFEITENKKIIEEKLNKKAEYLAYPWGHKYTGKIKDIENLGVKGIVLTTGGTNNRKIKLKKILRVNGDRIKDYKIFLKELKKFIK